MKLTRYLFLIVLTLSSMRVSSQTTENFDLFAQRILDDAQLLYKIARATQISNETVKSEPRLIKSNNLSYQKSNGNIKTIFWTNEAEYSISRSFEFDTKLDIIEKLVLPKSPTTGELLLITAYNQTKEIIDTKDLELESRQTELIPIFVFLNQLKSESILVDNDTEIIVFLIRDDVDQSVVPYGGDFYIEVNGNGKPKDIFSIEQDYSFKPGKINIEGEQVTGIIHEHNRYTEPIISSTEICSILMHRDIIEWENFTVNRALTDSTFTEAVYSLQDKTLKIFENRELLYGLPNWSVIVECGKLSFQMFIESYDEIDEKIFKRTEESWRKTMVIYKPYEALKNWPDIKYGRNGVIKIVFKKGKCDLFPEDLKALLK